MIQTRTNRGAIALGVAAWLVASGAAPAALLEAPARALPVPTTVSPALQGLIAQPYSPTWNITPKTDADWRAFVAKDAIRARTEVEALAQTLHVRIRPIRLAGLGAFRVEPEVITRANRGRLLMHLHGGAYVFAPGEAGAREAVLVAHFVGAPVVSIDYRMPPDAPYPAALDDAVAAWKALAATHNRRTMGVFGNSAGGGLALALVERLKAQHAPLPAAIWAGTPWTDLAKRGDSYFVNDHVDRVIVSYDGLLGAAARLYAGGHSFDEPGLSPINGDVRGFPPTLLTTGTRDIFLSNTARFHRKLRAAGVETQMDVLEGQSHDDYERLPDAPETRELYAEIAAFFDKWLAR